MHTTNYFNTFIEIAQDYKFSFSKIPESKGDKITIALLQYKLLAVYPYKYTSDEILFAVFATRTGLSTVELDEARKDFFSKGQPCFRASPLTKSYGFGIHFNENGKVALFAIESKEYADFISNPDVLKVKAMKSSKAK